VNPYRKAIQDSVYFEIIMQDRTVKEKLYVC